METNSPLEFCQIHFPSSKIHDSAQEKLTTGPDNTRPTLITLTVKERSLFEVGVIGGRTSQLLDWNLPKPQLQP